MEQQINDQTTNNNLELKNELPKIQENELANLAIPRNNLNSNNTAEISVLTSKLENSQKELQILKNNCLNFFAKKYQINLSNQNLDYQSLDFSDLEKLEHSLLQVCENNNIQFVTAKEQQESTNFFNTFQKTKLYY